MAVTIMVCGIPEFLLLLAVIIILIGPARLANPGAAVRDAFNQLQTALRGEQPSQQGDAGRGKHIAK